MSFKFINKLRSAVYSDTAEIERSQADQEVRERIKEKLKAYQVSSKPARFNQSALSSETGDHYQVTSIKARPYEPDYPYIEIDYDVDALN